MRVLHVTDIHCSTNRLAKVLDQEVYDLVVATGDFECVDTAETLMARAKTPVVAITGNMDDPSIARILRDAGVLLDGRVAEVKALRVAGIGGLDAAGSLSALRRKLRGNERIDILLSHHPPKGVLDRTFIGIRIGLREILDLVNNVKPSVHVFGHVHESRGAEKRGKTLFVNAGPLKRGYYAVLERDRGFWSVRLLHTH